MTKINSESKTKSDRKSYIPALRFSSLTKLYDPLIRLTIREAQFKSRLIESTGLRNGFSILDVGCGTGTLTIMLKQSCTSTTVTGIDGDPAILEIARKKAHTQGVALQLDQGMAFEMPYQDGSFDRVVSSLMFHHLSTNDKIRTFKQIHRILKPVGEFHFADWDKPQNILMRAAFFGVELLDGFPNTADHVKGRLPELLSKSGFRQIKRTQQYMTLFGTLSLFSAIP